MPAAGNGDVFAVLLSGDGGWAGLDKDVASALAAQGISVVGLDSLRYFWTARTPDTLAADLDRVLRYYTATWHKSHAVLIGYSQGADVLPFAVNRLPSASRSVVERTVMMGLGENASFEFHFTNWLGADSGLPILPEVARLDAGSDALPVRQGRRRFALPEGSCWPRAGRASAGRPSLRRSVRLARAPNHGRARIGARESRVARASNSRDGAGGA